MVGHPVEEFAFEEVDIALAEDMVQEAIPLQTPEEVHFGIEAVQNSDYLEKKIVEEVQTLAVQEIGVLGIEEQAN